MNFVNTLASPKQFKSDDFIQHFPKLNQTNHFLSIKKKIYKKFPLEKFCVNKWCIVLTKYNYLEYTVEFEL